MTSNDKFIRDMEQDIIQIFSGQVQSKFLEINKNGDVLPYVVGTALCGQDQALADYLIAANSRFTLIEFKANENALSSEGEKKLRVKLLDACETNSALRARSQAMHCAAWGELTEITIPGLVAPQSQVQITVCRYIPQIAKILNKEIPNIKCKEWQSEDFISTFLESMTNGGGLKRFKRYLQDLYEIAGTSGTEGLENFQGSICVWVPPTNGISSKIQVLKFSSFEHLMKLTIHFDNEYLMRLERNSKIKIERKKEIEREIGKSQDWSPSI
ncbi:hypothetical protein H8K32_10005 [Undibacterium jejuense]|uniref:Uncharacterized protein n=1 Tax=Undibacterium jejuense TaxID=1344949 RepID=A0A923HMP1_9BURK|nr:hypothetical protein [Undibacterium jejuense]MBC3862431.1 hypothetical protein [Undibacterium jejuense]